MELLRKEAWQYAILLILLLAIAALAVHTTIAYLQEQVPDNVRSAMTLAVWALTLGFMLIAGAFGLWAIQFSTRSQAQRSVSRFAEELHFIRDGLVTLDRRGRVTGANPSARSLSATETTSKPPLRDAFPVLSENDVQDLLNPNEPAEVQRDMTANGESRLFRFRSQPSHELHLVLISDITAINRQQLRTRRIARLQLIGQIATGAANDLNTLLCSIEGHASLLEHLAADIPDFKASLTEITHETRQGIALAGHLMEFGRLATDGTPTEQPSYNVALAAESLRATLPEGWDVQTTLTDDLPPVPLTAMQLEQTVLNLGLLAADSLSKPGRVWITAARPGASHMLNVDPDFAAVILISVLDPDVTEELTETPTLDHDSDEAGALQSILNSMIGSAGGKLERLSSARGWTIYRIALPHAVLSSDTEIDADLPAALQSYMSNWRVLIARQTRDHVHLARHLEKMDVHVEQADEIVTALARVEEAKQLDVMIFDARLFGDQAAGLLRAIVKLRPTAGIVVLTTETRPFEGSLAGDVICESSDASANRILRAMITARSLGMRRKQE